MPRNPAATRARILEAAVQEFSDHGLAGARVDRIAEVAQANKRSIYVYFGSKDDLFTAAFDHAVADVSATVPIDAGDLPGYAVRLFDHLLEHPEAWRMSTWQLLERPTAAGNDPTGGYAAKVAALVPHGSDLADTLPNGYTPTDLFVMISGLVSGWLYTPQPLLAADGSDPADPARRAQHRRAIETAVRRIVGPPGR